MFAGRRPAPTDCPNSVLRLPRNSVLSLPRTPPTWRSGGNKGRHCGPSYAGPRLQWPWPCCPSRAVASTQPDFSFHASLPLIPKPAADSLPVAIAAFLRVPARSGSCRCQCSGTRGAARVALHVVRPPGVRARRRARRRGGRIAAATCRRTGEPSEMPDDDRFLANRNTTERGAQPCKRRSPMSRLSRPLPGGACQSPRRRPVSG